METTTATIQCKVTVIPAKQAFAGVNIPDLRPKRVSSILPSFDRQKGTGAQL